MKMTNERDYEDIDTIVHTAQRIVLVVLLLTVLLCTVAFVLTGG